MLESTQIHNPSSTQLSQPPFRTPSIRPFASSSDIVCRTLPLMLPNSSPSGSPVSDPLANVQLPAVGVCSPFFALSDSPEWNSPKSNESSEENDDENDVENWMSDDGAPAPSAKGPKPSSWSSLSIDMARIEWVTDLVVNPEGVVPEGFSKRSGGSGWVEGILCELRKPMQSETNGARTSKPSDDDTAVLL